MPIEKIAKHKSSYSNDSNSFKAKENTYIKNYIKKHNKLKTINYSKNLNYYDFQDSVNFKNDIIRQVLQNDNGSIIDNKLFNLKNNLNN